jgi:hypothetical protein
VAADQCGSRFDGAFTHGLLAARVDAGGSYRFVESAPPAAEAAQQRAAGDARVTSLGLSLGMAALALTLLGLESLMGMTGFGLGAAVIMLLGNPLSGLASGPHWLPNGWSTLGQLLPPGASGSLLRANAFFDGTGAGAAALTLGCWVLFGLILLLVSARRGPRQAAAEEQTSQAQLA